MTYWRKKINRKTAAFILAVCLAVSAVGLPLFIPHKVQAGCPVSIVSDSDHPIETRWEALQALFRGDNIVNTLGTWTETVWRNSNLLVEWSLGVLIDLLLHQLLAELTNDIVNWIQNGEEPRFVSEGIGSFLGDVIDKAGGDFVENYLNLGWMCEPFDMDIKTALQDVSTFEERVTCTLTDVVDNIDDFYDDFSKGGWPAWIETAKPQNNLYGAFLLAEFEKMREEEKAEAQAEFDALTGGGFLSVKDCKWYDKNGNFVAEQTDVRGQPTMPQACIDNTELRPCRSVCETLTPGSLVDEVAKKSTVNYWDQLNEQIGAATEKAGPFKVYIHAIVSALINRVITEGVGLLKAEDEDIPQSGSFGAAGSLPNMADPSAISMEKLNAEILSGKLTLLKQYAENLLEEQEANLAVLKLIPPAYSSAKAALGNLAEQCSAYTYWANEKISELDGELQGYNNQAGDLENVEIPKTVSLIQDISSSHSLVQDFIGKADIWLQVWKSVDGDASSQALMNAKRAMDEARILAIQSVQGIVGTISGMACSVSTFVGLCNEVNSAINALVQAAISLQEERGYPEFPETGTLWGAIDKAESLEEQAINLLAACLAFQ